MATAGKPETQSVAKDAARSRPRNVLFSADEAGRHMLDGTIRVLLAEGLLLPAGLAIAAFLTRWLGPGGYGLYTLAAAIVWWVESCVTSIFSRATVKLVGTAQDWNSGEPRSCRFTCSSVCSQQGFCACSVRLWPRF